MTATTLLSTPALLRRLRDIEDARDRLNLEHAHLSAVLEARGAVRPRRRRPEARHGTDGGYHAHRRRWHTPACEPCLRAHAAVNADAVRDGAPSWDVLRARLDERGVTTRRVRLWARRAGLDVGAGSKLPGAVIAAWLEAHPVDLAAAA